MFRKATKSGQVDLMQLVVCALSSYSNALLWVLLAHIAASHHQMKCSKSLNVNTQTLTGWTPLHIAVRNGQVRGSCYFAYRTLERALLTSRRVPIIIGRCSCVPVVAKRNQDEPGHGGELDASTCCLRILQRRQEDEAHVAPALAEGDQPQHTEHCRYPHTRSSTQACLTLP